MSACDHRYRRLHGAGGLRPGEIRAVAAAGSKRQRVRKLDPGIVVRGRGVVLGQIGTGGITDTKARTLEQSRSATCTDFEHRSVARDSCVVARYAGCRELTVSKSASIRQFYVVPRSSKHGLLNRQIGVDNPDTENRELVV